MISDKELNECESEIKSLYFNKKENFPPAGWPVGAVECRDQYILSLISSLREAKYQLKTMHEKISVIRRATDDIPSLKDINRMAREALTSREIEE
jgi:hypothetical protein